jgi:peptide/nickel transport system substrate-binding protein
LHNFTTINATGAQDREEVTISTVAPIMAVFNNLVIFDQHVPQNTLQSIVPDLATTWSRNEDGTGMSMS